MRILGVAVLLALLATTEAGACVCVGQTPQERMASADAAFIGEVTAIRSEAGKRVYTIAVEKAYKGDVGDTVEVRGADPERGGFSSCDEVLAMGDSFGGYFEGPPQDWYVFTCNLATREQLEEGATGFPAPTGGGEAVALLNGPVGSSSPFAALDARGRVVAYAKGSTTGNAVWLSPCPGGRRVVESTYGALRTRRLSDLKVLRTKRTRVSQVRCVDAAGTTVMAERNSRLVRISGDRIRTLTRGTEQTAPGPRSSLASDFDGRVTLLDSRTGRGRRLGTFRRLAGLSVSPDGARLAVLAAGRLRIYSAAGRRISSRRTRGGREQIAWAGRRALTLPLHRRGGDVVGGRVWWARDGVLRSSPSGYAASRTIGPVPAVAAGSLTALPRPVRITDASRFNPSASGGSPPRARRARAGGDAPAGDCPKA